MHINKTLVGYRVTSNGLSSKKEAILYGYLIRNFYGEKSIQKSISVSSYIHSYFLARNRFLESLLIQAVSSKRILASLLFRGKGMSILGLSIKLPVFLLSSFIIVLGPVCRLGLKCYLRAINR